MITYYYTLASRKFLLEEEPVEEILRERLNFYQANNIDLDFWLIKNLSQLKISELTMLEDQIKTEAAVIISTNKHFIDWLKLRLQYVKIGTFQNDSIYFSQVLKNDNNTL